MVSPKDEKIVLLPSRRVPPEHQRHAVCPVAAKLLADICGFLVTTAGLRPDFRSLARDRLVVDLTGGLPSEPRTPGRLADAAASPDSRQHQTSLLLDHRGDTRTDPRKTNPGLSGERWVGSA